MDVFSLIKTNNLLDLKKYLSYGDINIVNSKRMSLLMFSIICNNINAFTILMDSYIDVNMQDINGYTALHYAIINNRLGFTKTLLRHGARLDIKNLNSESPLYKACILGREEIISLILEQYNIDFFEQNIYNDTIFNALIRSHNLKLVKLVPLCKEILEHKNIFGDTPLHISTKINDINITTYLLENNVFPNSKNNDYETPIFNTFRNSNMELTTLLYNNGALLNLSNRFNEELLSLGNNDFKNEIPVRFQHIYDYSIKYPLHYNIICENIIKINDYLIDRYLKTKDNHDYYPIDLAINIGNEQIIKIIKQQ